MQSLLPRLGQDIAIEPFASIEDMLASGSAKFDLVLYYIHDNAEEIIGVAIKALTDTPIPVLVLTNNETADLNLVFGERMWPGICGLVSTADTDSKLLSAGIRFVLSGGTFFPLEMIVKNAAPPPPSLPVRKGRGTLTPRQSEVFAKLQQGKPNKLIAYELGMSESTIKVHVSSIIRAMGASNRTQAVSILRQRANSAAGSQDHD